MIKVAIFGGSFDPPHKGHQQIAKNALDLLDIDRLIIVPTYLNPLKKTSYATADKRLEWCHQLFDSNDKIEVSDYEVRLQKPVYTSESLKHFGELYNAYYLIIGSDNLLTITQWKDFEWLNSEIVWVVVARKGYTLETNDLKRWILLENVVEISSTQVKQGNLNFIDKRIVEDVKKTIEINKENR